MNPCESSPNPLDRIAEEFVARCRGGDQPEIAAYVARYPDNAREIEELFPTLLALEQLKPTDERPPLAVEDECASKVAALGQLGDYQIVREIGRGGMGIVYEAIQVSLGRQVALKVLPRQPLSDATRQGRFEREAKAAARLHHTNIVPVFGVGEAEGLHFYAMQYIHGLGLDEVLRELQAHRDPKPSASTVDQRAHPALDPTEAPKRVAADRIREFSVTITQALWQGRLAEHDVPDAPPLSASGASAVTLDHSPRRNPEGRETTVAPVEPLARRPQPQSPSLHAAETIPSRFSQTGRRSSLHHLGVGSQTEDRDGRQTNFHRSVARIGIQVAEALDYAHEQGVLHRDIKPSNLLLDTRGTTWVTDFGLAKADDQEALTCTGDVLGTLRYMAPELFNGQADRRSDIYSLGLTLYELLALRPAFDESDRGRLIRLVLQETPPRLRNLDPAIPRDLETIIHKASDRDPAHRYPTARELADDLQRYLHDEPILARRASLTAKFTRWCKRNPAVARLTMTIAALLVASAATSLGWLFYSDFLVTEQGTALDDARQDELAAVQEKRDAQLARERADDAANQERLLREEAERQRDRANANFARPRRAVDEYVSKVMADEQLALPDLRPLREDLLREAYDFYNEFAREASDDPKQQLELAKAQLKLAVIQRELGQTGPSREAGDEAIRRFQSLQAQRLSDEDVVLGLAEAYLFANRPLDAVTLCDSVLQSTPGRAAAREMLARACAEAARDAIQGRDTDQALAQVQRAFDLRRQLATEAPRNAEFQGKLAAASNQWGIALVQANRLEEALAKFQSAAVGPASEAVRLAPQSIQWGRIKAITLANAAEVSARIETLHSAVDLAMQGALQRQQVAALHPSSASLRGEWYQALRGLSHMERRAGLTERAERTARAMRILIDRMPHQTPAELFQVAAFHASLTLPSDPAALSGDLAAPSSGDTQQHGESALQALQQAVDLGWTDSAALANHRSFDALRERTEFHRLAALVESIAEADRLLASKAQTDEERLTNQRKAADILGKLAAEHPQQIRHQQSLASTLHAIGMVQMRLGQFDQASQSLGKAVDQRGQIRERLPDDAQVQLDWLSSRAALGELHWLRAEFPEAHHVWRECLRNVDDMADRGGEDMAIQLPLADIQGQIIDRYAQAAVYPLVQQILARNAEKGRVRGIWRGAGTPSDGEFSAGLLLSQDRAAARPYFQAFRNSLLTAETDLWFEHAMLLRGLALLDSSQVDVASSLEKVREYLTKNPGNSWVNVSLAAYEFSRGEYRQAAERLATHRNHVWGQEAYLFIALDWRLGNREQAFERWRRAEQEHSLRMAELLGQSPLSHPRGIASEDWWQFAYVLAMRRLAAETMAEGKTPPPDHWLHLLQAHGYLLIGELELGLAEIATAVDGAPEDARLQVAAARLKLSAGVAVADVESIWSRLVELDKTDPLPFIQRGRWFSERGERALAAADYAHAASLTPKELNRFLEAGWWVAGPYPENVSEFGAPELQADPAIPVDVVDSQSGVPENSVSWRSVSVSHLGQLSQASFARARGGESAYALTHVFAPEERTATLCITSQSPAILWINGERVWQFVQPDSGAKYTATDPARFPIVLRQGVNSILVKGGVNSGLTVRLGDSRWDRAQELARHGEWKKAADLIEEELRRVPTSMANNGYLYARFAMYRYAEGNLDAVRRIYRELKAGLPRPATNYWKYRMTQIGGMAPGIVDDPAELYEWVPPEKQPFNAWQRAIFCWAPYRMGNWRELLDRFNVARELNPLDAETSPFEAAAYYHLGEPRETQSALSQMQTGLDTRRVEWASRSPDNGVYLGFALPREAARVVWGSTEDIDREFAEFYRQRRARRDRFSPETFEFDAAVEVYPATSHLHAARARRLSELGRYVEADASYRRAIELAPSDNEVATARASFLVEMGRDNEAASLYKAVLSRMSQNRWLDGVPINMALVLLRENNAASNESVSSDVLHQLCACYRSLTQGRLDWNSRSFAILQQQNPHSAACLALLAENRPLFAQIRDQQTPSVDPYFRTIILGLEPISGSQLDDLRQSVTAMLAARPDDAWSRRFSGLALMREGRHAEARDLLLKSLSPTSQWQGDGVVYPLLALAHHHLGERDSARQWLEKSRRWLRWHTEITDEEFVLLRQPNRVIPRDWLLLALVYHREAVTHIEGREVARTESARVIRRDAAATAKTLSLRHKSRLDRILAGGTPDPQPWIERGKWHAEQGDDENANADYARAAALAPNQLNRFLDAGWWVIGPYSKNLDEPCPPEFDADPSRILPVLTPAASRRSTWRTVQPDASGHVDLSALPELHEGGGFYACSHVYAPTDRTTWLMIDKQTPLRIWVNGQLVQEFRIDEQPALLFYEAFHRIPVALKSGRNLILIKTTGPKFTVRIGDTPRDRVLRNFEQERFGAAFQELDRLRETERLDASADWTRRALLLYFLEDDPECWEESCRQIFPWTAQAPNDAFRRMWQAYVSAHHPTRAFERYRGEALSIIDKMIAITGENEAWPKVYGALIAYRANEFERARELLDGTSWKAQGLPLQALLALHAGDQARAEQKLNEAFASAARYEVAWVMNDRTDILFAKSPSWVYDWLSFLVQLGEAEQTLHGRMTRTRQIRERFAALAEQTWTNAPETWAYDHVVSFQVHQSSWVVKYPQPFVRRAERLAGLGRFSEAEADFQRALTLAPDDGRWRLAHARFLAARGRRPEAAAAFAKAHGQNSDHPITGLLDEQLRPGYRRGWQFATPSIDSPRTHHCQARPADGLLAVEVQGEAPHMEWDLVAGAGAWELAVCLRTQGRMERTSLSFGTTATTGTTTPSSAPIQLTAADGQWRVYRTSLTSPEDLRGLRLKLPANAGGRIEVAWLALIQSDVTE